ncbi:AI-2E family transporter [Mesorhizobium australicum]|uniref:Predicted PurR-regulated permease PerM n=1 Tax=Mesorhizobium australicum TaxID=536018 RepID=A0A1X7PEB3_9HYPH|nr:AI-2E family transporter [Mesorhizobium australicum]SMH48777.1 Predicted PurR-regulated permease PerM [Mesorhizobium australicum]
MQNQIPLFGPMRTARPAVVPPLTAARWLLVLIVLAGAYFFHGFVVPVLAALVIAFATWPLYRRLLRFSGENRSVAATLALLLILAFLIAPIALVARYAVAETQEWVSWVVAANRTGAVTPDWIATLPWVGEFLAEQWMHYFGHPGGFGEVVQLVSGSNIRNIYLTVVAAGGSAFSLFLTLLFMLIALFFVYRDGTRFLGQVDLIGERVLPGRWDRISRVVPATISSTVTGMTIIAFGEGIVLGVAYYIAGVPSPVTLGVITGVMALIPGGAPLSMTLVSIYLAASGSPFAGIALFAWGTIELFVVDKTIRPKLVGGPIKLPFLPTIFGLVGGVKTMGFLGLFVGPVLMALLVAIWREWIHELEVTAAAARPALDVTPAPDLEERPAQVRT